MLNNISRKVNCYSTFHTNCMNGNEKKGNSMCFTALKTIIIKGKNHKKKRKMIKKINTFAGMKH